MHAKYLWIIDDGETLDVLPELLDRVLFGTVVGARLGIHIAFVQGLLRKEGFQDGAETALVPVVSYSAPVGDLEQGGV